MSKPFDIPGCRLPDDMEIRFLDETGSTNDEARKLGKTGAREGTVVVAERQTSGRGRRGAAWVCPPGESLAFSILLRPGEAKPLWPRLALAAGLAVAEALDAFGVEAGVKWPNDVWVRGRKICGILVEADADFAVVGMGINVNTGGFPEELEDIATSLRIETGVNHQREDVLSRVLTRFEIRRRQIGAEFSELLQSLSERCVLAGKHISLLTAGGRKEGVMEGYAPGGELKIRTEAGLETIIQADEVRVIS
jgi:BirA family biotin operon repressor/biotin-[acetyl-CoA-carboxylase] ligase